jgi:hypothetical protein
MFSFYQIRILEVMRRRLSLPLLTADAGNSGNADSISTEKSLARGLRTPGHFLIALQFRRIPRGFEPASTPPVSVSSATASSTSSSPSKKSPKSSTSERYKQSSLAKESATSEKSAAASSSASSSAPIYRAGPTRSRRTLTAFWSQGTLAVRRAARWAACRNQV